MKKLGFFMLCLVMCFCCFVSSSYASEYPNFDDLVQTDKNHYGYVVYQHGTSGVVYLVSYYSSNIEATHFENTFTSDSKLSLYLKDDNNNSYNFSYTIYTIGDGEWERYSGYTNEPFFRMSVGSNVLIFESTDDIYKYDGTLFFQAPPEGMSLTEAIQVMIHLEMEKFPKILVGAMKILVLCGVGCLALLMVFPLFGKVLRIFRLR